VDEHDEILVTFDVNWPSFWVETADDAMERGAERSRVRRSLRCAAVDQQQRAQEKKRASTKRSAEVQHLDF
jgi:hypothetical protein